MTHKGSKAFLCDTCCITRCQMQTTSLHEIVYQKWTMYELLLKPIWYLAAWLNTLHTLCLIYQNCITVKRILASDLYPILRFAFKKLQFLLPKLVPNGNNEGSVLLRNNNTREGMQTKVLNTKQRGYLASRPAALEFWCDLWTLGCNQLWNGISFGALPSVWL